MPLAPVVLLTHNFQNGATVVIAPSAAATKYRLQWTGDNGRTWTDGGESGGNTFDLRGLTAERKIHVRAIAMNADHQSEPGPEYPVYVTSKAPAPPDGLMLDLEDGRIAVSWGQVLGVSKYRLYRRKLAGGDFGLVYDGESRRFSDPGASMVEYRVTGVNGNGEGAPSHAVSADPASWLNWDPAPGEPFRRNNVRGVKQSNPDYYPQ